ncbi:MAG: hypothetical protein ACLQU4_16225 [Limisphaerales bacterium]
MQHLLKLTAGIFLFTGNFLVQGQFLAPGGLPPGFHHALLDVLAAGPSFYGRATVQMSNGPEKDPTIIPCHIAVLSGNMRFEADSFQPGSNVPPAQVAQLKHMHSISILRPDRNRMYMVFPDFKSFVEIAYSKSTGTDAAPPPQISKTRLGSELLGDQPCAKTQWKVTEPDGEHYVISVWVATNSSTFPNQIEIGPALVTFQNLSMEPPDASLFEPPASYIKYEGIQEIILRDAEKARHTNEPLGLREKTDTGKERH